MIARFFHAAVFAAIISQCFAAAPLPELPKKHKRQAGSCTKPGGPQPTSTWHGWGGGIHNRRQPGSDATVKSSNVGSLSKVCEQRYTPGVSASPLVQDGVAYFPTWSGLLVAMEYRNCKVKWTTNVTDIILKHAPLNELQMGSGISAVSRTSPVTDGKNLFIGTSAHALLLAIDKFNGQLVSKLQLDPHPVAIITQSPTFYDGAVLMGVSSLEVVTAVIPGYPCCSHVGSMNAITLSGSSLKLKWSTPMMTQPNNVTGPAFSGASVWGSQPAVDEVRKQVYIATGNTHSVPDQFEACQIATQNLDVVKQGLVPDPCLPRNIYQESILALDLATGRINWARQLGALDAWNVACVGGSPGASCPAVPGLDSDFGMAPSYVPGSANTPFGKDTLVIGQKSGQLYAVSAETGTVFWTTTASPPGLEGGLSWGLAADDLAVYFTAINNAQTPFTAVGGQTIASAAFGAANLKDGKLLWQVGTTNRSASVLAPTVVNDVVLTGTTGPLGADGFPTGPGSFVALNKATGATIKEWPLTDYFHGGIAVAKEYVLYGTGYLSGLQPPFAGGVQVWKV